MLYVSTRKTTDTYTAHRALHESFAPDGGLFVPFHLPPFTQEEMASFKGQTPGEVIARILNHFFGLHLTGWDVECAIGRTPVKMQVMHHRLIVAEAWHNSHGNQDYLMKNLFAMATGKGFSTSAPEGWLYVAIEIALLFSIITAIDTIPEIGLDIAVSSGDYRDILAVIYAKDMGLPVNMIICACDEKGKSWDLFNRGELSTSGSSSSEEKYLEHLLLKRLGVNELQRYFDAVSKRSVYRVDTELITNLNGDVFAAVVSTGRVDSIISNIYRTNQYYMDAGAALIYGGLQDYRARTGEVRDTLIIAKQRHSKAEV